MARPKKKSSEVVTTIGASVLPSVEEEIEAIAETETRSKAWVAGKFLVRGLKAFRADGKFTEEESPKAVKRTVSSKSRKPSQAAIRKALATALGFSGEPMTDSDRETIRKFLEEGGTGQQKARPRKRAKK